MATQTHTPGPWHVEHKGDTPHEKWIMADRWTRVARADGGSAANFIANAKLIAAAPELLAALREIIRNAGYEGGEAEPSLHELNVSISCLDTARAAIEVATC